MLWINFLHFYQPATLDRETIIIAIEKSYRRLVRVLQRNAGASLTANIQGCLLEKMHELGYQPLLRDLKKLVGRGQLELVGSAAYHPILPLVPATEAEAQIRLQEQLLNKYFGTQSRRGFFLPEMAYAPATAKLIKKLGYEWLILDEAAAPKSAGNVTGAPGRDAHSGLTVVFRNRRLSQSYVPQTIDALPTDQNRVVITATDAELYGLRHVDVSGQLEKTLRRADITTQTVSSFIASRPPQTTVKLRRSSWESTPAELTAGLPYALWYNETNDIQMKLWGLARLALQTVARHQQDPQRRWALWRLRRGLASCTFWWASGKKLSVWEELSWNPDEIERGLNELIKSVRALDNTATRATKVKAEKLYLRIKQLIWNKHWTYYWKK